MGMFHVEHPILEDGEKVLADKGYCGAPGAALGLITPFKNVRISLT